MKNILLIILAMSLFGCSTSDDHSQHGISDTLDKYLNAETTLTFFVLDKSQSRSVSNLNTESKVIGEVINSRLKKTGDKVMLIYAFANSNTLSNVYNYELKTPTPKELGLSSNTSKMELANFLKSISIEKNEIVSKVQKISKVEASSKSSQLIESFYTIKRAIQSSMATDINIYLFSDLQQSSKEFTLKANTLKEAIELSYSHAERLKKDFLIDSNTLENVSLVQAFIPLHTGLDENYNSNYAEAYWEDLLRSLGYASEFKIEGEKQPLIN